MDGSSWPIPFQKDEKKGPILQDWTPLNFGGLQSLNFCLKIGIPKFGWLPRLPTQSQLIVTRRNTLRDTLPHDGQDDPDV